MFFNNPLNYSSIKQGLKHVLHYRM